MSCSHVTYKVNRPNLGHTSIVYCTNRRGATCAKTKGFQKYLCGIGFLQQERLHDRLLPEDRRRPGTQTGVNRTIVLIWDT